MTEKFCALKNETKIGRFCCIIGIALGQSNITSKPTRKTNRNEGFLGFIIGFLNNFFSTTNVVEAFKNLLIKSKGTIICISSIAGMEVIGSPLTYLTAKASLNAYVKGISKYFGKKRVRINTITPGNVMFDGSVWEKQKKHNPALVKNVLSQVPLKRFGKPEEIGYAVAFLASPKSSFTRTINIGTFVVCVIF